MKKMIAILCVFSISLTAAAKDLDVGCMMAAYLNKVDSIQKELSSESEKCQSLLTPRPEVYKACAEAAKLTIESDKIVSVRQSYGSNLTGFLRNFAVSYPDTMKSCE